MPDAVIAPLIVFRADASIRIGNGHIARCLALAHALREQGGRCVFISRIQPGAPFELIEANGFEAVRLAHAGHDGTDSAEIDIDSSWPERDQAEDALQTVAASQRLGQDVSWLVVDHYGLDVAWELRVASHTQRILVIDDLANRRHECDALLDQNYYAGLERRYHGLVQRGCRLHLGPGHVLLRREFRVERAAMRERDGIVRRILVAFGSSDESGETIKALAALQSLRRTAVAIDVVVGATNPRRAEVRALCGGLENCTYHEQVDYIARLIGAADLGLGAGGSAMWERCVLGLPSLTVVTAANQLHTALDTSATGAIVFLGEANAVKADAIAEAVANAIDHPPTNREVTRCALNLVPRAEGADRLAAAMSGIRDAGDVAPDSPASSRDSRGLNQRDPS